MRRYAHVLLALIVALAAALPVSVRAMPMPAGMAGMAMHDGCPNCPHNPSTGANSDQMAPCQILACAGVVATLPTPALLPGRVFLRAAYLMALPVRWTGARPAPDPLPPRPILPA